jgi:hypothetical protein
VVQKHDLVAYYDAEIAAIATFVHEQVGAQAVVVPHGDGIMRNAFLRRKGPHL